MEVKVSDVLALKIAYILLRSYQFRFMMVQNDDKNIWLTNPDNRDFGLIKIASGLASESFFNREYISRIRENVGAMLRDNISLLEIYTNEEHPELNQEENSLVWSTNAKAAVPNQVLEVFPLLRGAFAAIEDPKDEYEQLRNDINDWQASQQNPRKQLKRRLPIVTFAFMLVCVFFFILSVKLGEITNDPVAVAIVIGAYYRAFVLGMQQYWRLLSAGFVHIELGHLAMNMVALFNIGSFLEPVLGRIKYTVVLVCAILGGNLLAFAAQESAVGLGASGGIYGLLAVLILFFLKGGFLSDPKLLRRVIMILVINACISLLPGISFMAHLGGFVVGLLFGVIFFFANYRALWINTIIAGAIMLVAVSYWGITNNRLEIIYLRTDNNIIEIYKRIGWEDYGKKVATRMAAFYGDQR